MSSSALTLRKAVDADLPVIYEIINDSASAYKGVIPGECFHDPYMNMDELRAQIADGVVFDCCERDGRVVGVMGLQEKTDVFLIRHAYVRTNERGHGIGSFLLNALYSRTDKPVLIGTWRDAAWAVSFYLKNGFSLVSEKEKNSLLEKYWNVPAVQSDNSVVLADERWLGKR
jgi:N-acetylglutamate synthase-like GNAT family acetyltransferase